MKIKLMAPLTLMSGALTLLMLSDAYALGLPSVTLTSSLMMVPYSGTVTLTWKSLNVTTCNVSGGWSGTVATSGSRTIASLTNSATFGLTCTGSNGKATQSITVIVAPRVAQPVVKAGTRLGVNINSVCDWCNDFTFVDIMKQARGFAGLSKPWDPVNDPVPVDKNGWPTQDFGVYFTSFPSDPLGRPLTQTNPSFFGTYKLSFLGQATLHSNGSKHFINQTYDAVRNITTAQLVVDNTTADIDIVFSDTRRTANGPTNTGLQNIQLLRPGYDLGTEQVFTTQFLNSLAPFSTLRFMSFLQTNGSSVKTWSARTPQTMPSQQFNTLNGFGVNGVNSGVAWEYVIQLANITGKDIWINIPHRVDLSDTSDNNYVTRLAKLLKANLKPNIHVYVEYSNEVWNSLFSQNWDNYNLATQEVSSGADKTLNFDNINNHWYWGFRRIAHQTQRISKLFAAVYGQPAINDIIRPVYMSQYVQPFIAEDSLYYLQKNFGSPNQYLYAIGGAPYFYLPLPYKDLNSFFISLLAGANQVVQGFSGLPVFSGSYPVYSNITYQNMANYFGLKNVNYEGGPDVSQGSSRTIDEQANNDPRMKNIVQNFLADALGCGNALVMFYSLQGSTGDPYAIYRDFAIPTQKSAAINTVSNTPLANYDVCTASISD